MKIAVNQPYFFPYIGYYQLIKSVDKFILCDNVNFIKRGWVNRNRILVKNYGPAWITVPLREQSCHAKITDTKIDNRWNWKRKMFQTIEMNYRKAPMFEQFYPVIRHIIDIETDSISELDANTIIGISNYLNIDTIIETDYSKYTYIEEEIDACESGDCPGDDKRVSRIVKICQHENADVYHNLIGGMSLYSKESFYSKNIKIKFLNNKPMEYRQSNGEFVPKLSIIDVLMLNSPAVVSTMLNLFELI
jgi:hypothetical protein